MAIVAQVAPQFASSAMAAGTAAQQVLNSAFAANNSPLLFPSGGNYVLQLLGSNLMVGTPITVKAQGFINRVVTGTFALGLTWGKTAASQAAMYTQVASASLTGSAAPGTAFKWQVEQKLVLDSMTGTADAYGPGSGNITAGATNAWMWIGNAGVSIAAGYPPAQLTGVVFGPTQTQTQPNPGMLGNVSLPEPFQVTQAVTTGASLFIGLNFTNGTSDPTGGFFVTDFYAVQD